MAEEEQLRIRLERAHKEILFYKEKVQKSERVPSSKMHRLQRENDSLKDGLRMLSQEVDVAKNYHD